MLIGRFFFLQVIWCVTSRTGRSSGLHNGGLFQPERKWFKGHELRKRFKSARSFPTNSGTTGWKAGRNLLNRTANAAGAALTAIQR